jgi:hypothetical protein
MAEDKPRLEINWVQSLAGALAAVTSAVLLSTVGVAGTLIGAAIGSLAATIGSAVYSYYLKVTGDRVAAAQALATARIGIAQTRVRQAHVEVDTDPEDADHQLAEAEEDLAEARAALEEPEPEPVPGGWRGVLAALPWKRILLWAGATFLVAMVVILVFELLTGRAVSSYTGGSDSDRRTSIPGLGGGGTADGGGTTDEPAPTGEPAPTDAPTGESNEEDLLVPSDGAASRTPTTPTSEATTPTELTPTPTPSPTAATTEASPTATPSVASTPSGVE